MKKRVLYTICVIQLLSICLLSRVFADGDFIKNFNKINIYTQDQFSDVSDQWFVSSVRQAYETGLMCGESETIFNPNGNIDNAAVIAIASRLHSIYNYGKENFESTSDVWYEPYFKYAINNGICDSDIDPLAISTRGLFAGIIGNSTDSSIFAEKNMINDGELPDVSGWYSDSVYRFYRAGVLSGNDKYGTFAPNTPITRAEVAAIVSRIVKPSERVAFALQTTPVGTYSIMQDDGSLAAFKQRAIVANLKVLLNGETQGPEWQNDIWTLYHPGIPGDDIYISRWDIEREYDGDLIYIFVPNRCLGYDGDGYTRVGDWNLYTGFRSYLKDYQGSMPNGRYSDLYLSKPEIAEYTEIHTYSEYTSEAQRLINNAVYIPFIDQNAAVNYIDDNYGESDSSLIVGYLTDWKGDWYITINNENMFNPVPRDNYDKKQSAFSFTPENEKIEKWCKKNFGKYVLALVSFDLKKPIFLAEILGYPASRESAAIQSWKYENDSLMITWKYPPVAFGNPMKLYSKDEIAYMSDVSGLEEVKYSSYVRTYYIGDIYDNKYFRLDDDNKGTIRVYCNGKTILFRLYSDKAVINGFQPQYDFMGDLTGYEDTNNGTTVTVTAPKRLYDDISGEYVYYLPPKFLNDTLFNKDNSNIKSSESNIVNKTEDEYAKEEEKAEKEIETLKRKGYARICREDSSEWSYYFEGYDNTKFRLRRNSNTIEGYEYAISKSNSGPHIGFNIDSPKICVQVWFNGTEYGEEIRNIPIVRKINGEVYLPVDEILNAMDENGQGFERKKI